MSEKILVLVVILAVMAVFMAIPAIIAMIKQHPERALIYKLSPLTILSFLLWFGLIAWAATGKSENAVVARYVAELRENNLLPLVVVLLVGAGLIGGIATLYL